MNLITECLKFSVLPVNCGQNTANIIWLKVGAMRCNASLMADEPSRISLIAWGSMYQYLCTLKVWKFDILFFFLIQYSTLTSLNNLIYLYGS